jgi:citrate synthase
MSVPGLENVIASETAISYLDVEKEEIVLRGYDLIELANNVTYLDIAGLLLDGVLPTSEERNSLEEKIKSEYGLPRNIQLILQLLPEQANMMDVLRTGISALASYDEEIDDRSNEANTNKAIRLLAKVPQIVANGFQAINNQPLIEPRKDLSYVSNFL